ncbi:sphingomyelin synthase-related protein 1-like [Styela clava]|uniref:sphingomyelin synthase-related protein 1-like n=1 Tax=Styela clava TaxID=7725 RepID=UPI00193AD469|nr:sphingomyelin synthase-related protein 1-like [Styela clava]
MELPNDITIWTCSQVEIWLKNVGFEKFVELVCNEHEVDGNSLLTLTENDLRSPPLQLRKLGDIKKLGACLKELRVKHAATLREKACLQRFDNYDPLSVNSSTYMRRRVYRHTNGSAKISQSLYSDESCMSDSTDIDDQDISHSSGRVRVFNPEYGKTLISFLYNLLAMFVTSYTMVVVHDRVPDKQKHPPLPDIFLDNVPLIPYAFKLSELCGLILMSMWFCILFFHKHRFILIRRMYSISSSVFLLRCITMFVTSLSVPGDHLQCQAAHYRTTEQRIKRALEIFAGGGMSLTGVHTCGDYMFSGHTIVLTLVNHLITEYTPARWYSLHIASWVFNLFGAFFILAAHEHYSIDIVIAFYITSRVFLYYHMLANTRSYQHSKRIRIWFPLFSYFECNVPGKVPNEYEWPLSVQKIRNLFVKIAKHSKNTKVSLN